MKRIGDGSTIRMLKFSTCSYVCDILFSIGYGYYLDVC